MKEECLHGAELLVALGARGERHVADELALRGHLLLGLRNLGSLRRAFWRGEGLRVGRRTQDREVHEGPAPKLVNVKQLQQG
eukprot:3979495-Pyramimonas_sp.AAC.1